MAPACATYGLERFVLFTDGFSFVNWDNRNTTSSQLILVAKCLLELDVNTFRKRLKTSRLSIARFVFT